MENLKEQKVDRLTLLRALNSPFDCYAIEFVFSDSNSIERVVTFETRLKPNPYITETHIGSFKDEYFSIIKKVLNNFGYDVSFNNTGRIFWILL